MKKIFLTLLLFTYALAFSQLAIGKATVSSNSVSLEFGNIYTNSPVSNTEPRGLVLPWVDGTNDTTPYITNSPISETVENGTLVYDKSDKKVKVKYATGWKDLSVDNNGTTIDPLTSIDGLAIQNTQNEAAEAKVIIGGTNPETNTTPGILILADTNKAMILPKVASPHLSIKNPAPGMMAYDTVKQQLAVFNGTVWTFWKP